MFGVAALSAWLSLTLTPAADIKLGVVNAQIQAAPGSGTVVRTAMGRSVTDDTLNAGPLQVQVAVAVQPAPRVTEPQLLEALSAARPLVISAAIGYLGRVTAGAVLLSLLLGFAVLGPGRRGRRMLVVGATTLAVVGAGVGATAATTRLSAFDAASCVHGWSRYAIADLPDLTPPAPRVTPPTEATARANPGLVAVVLIADDHLNPEGLVFAHRLQTSTGARAVWDAGDTTSYGVPGEACVIAPQIRSFRVPYIWVRGNHDSSRFERVMRGIRGVHVLEGTTATTAGITVFGVGDPSFTPRRRTTSAVMAANDARVRASLPTLMAPLTTLPDVVLVHECQMAVSQDPSARGVAGLVPLVVCGHTHRHAQSSDDTTTVLHTGTVGAGGLDAFSVGGLQNFDAQLLLLDATTHRLVRYYDVNGSGASTATFTRYDIQQPVVTPPEHGGL